MLIYFDSGKARDVFRRFNDTVTGINGGWTGVPDYTQNPCSNKVSTIILKATEPIGIVAEQEKN